MNSSTAHFLVGRIHHLISSDAFSHKRHSNKRPRPWEISNADSPMRDSISANQDNRRLKGFILECEESRHNFTFHLLSGNLFHLVIPLPLIKDACHAAATGKTVQISQYSLILYRRDGRGELLFDSRDSKTVNYETYDRNDNDTGTRCIFVVEVHCDGLTIRAACGGIYSTQLSPHMNKQKEVIAKELTLEMLSIKEQTCSKYLKDTKVKAFSKKEPMNITAVVDAISPILVDDTFGKPFALMELYQPNSSPMHSAVAVLRGENALCMHAAILPGQPITLIGVISRSWKVPEVFRRSSTKSNALEGNHCTETLYLRLYRRTPDRVIVVEGTHSIRLKGETHEVPPLPSTVESLTSIRGVVESIQFYRHDDLYSKKTERIIHLVTIKNHMQQNTFDNKHEDSCESVRYDNDGNQLDSLPSLATINLLKYSFAPHILLGLQPGAVIRAANVHCINSSDNTRRCYIGCLRSTVTIERCAGDSSDRPNIPWVTPIFKPFVLLPHYRIADVCSDPIKSVPTSRYIEEECLLVKVKSIIVDSSSATQQMRILLAHHHNLRISSNISRSTDEMSTSVRDPYAEFFDHAHSDRLPLQKECGNFVLDNFSAVSFNGDASLEQSAMPNVVRLDTLREKCTHDFIHKIASFCNIESGHVQASPGWTSSHHYFSSKVYVWGRVKFERNKPELRGSVGVIGDNACTIPFSVASERNKFVVQCQDTDFQGWLQVKSVLVCCLCVGVGTVQDSNESANYDDSPQRASSLPYHFLPSALVDSNKDSTLSHVFIFSVGSSIFIGSIHIIVIPVHSKVAVSPCNIDPAVKENILSIQRCLEQTEHEVKESSVSIIGRLIRQRFQFRKVKLSSDRSTQFYEGWTMCLSNIDESQEDILSTSSMLQTIDIRISVPVGTARLSKSDPIKFDLMKNALQTALTALVITGSSGTNGGDDHSAPFCKISSDQLTMALAFWCASEHHGMQPVLCGGWESCNNRLLAENETSSTYQSMSVYVELPITSREITKLGYQRFRCNLDNLRSFMVLETFRVPKSSSSSSSQFLDFSVNTGKFLPGMLGRRLCRTQPFISRSEAGTTTRIATSGMVIKNPYTALTTLTQGVSSVTLADLHWDICNVLIGQQPSRLNPSLLRHIHNAKVLGISFCRARVECTLCFQFLISSRSDDRTLLCPTGCRSVHAAIKWECSALIDDGTGQSKIYAEREAALLLLGSSLDVTAVEEGAWACESGVFFQPSLPPSSYLRRSIKAASMEVRKHSTLKKHEAQAKSNTNGKTPVTYDFLTPVAKAEYILQLHCRQWYKKHHHLQLDFFCRCKPLSIDVTTVNRTEIQVATAIDGFGLDFGNAQTTSLPPLKLILEDVCVASEDNQDDRWTGWDMLHELERS